MKNFLLNENYFKIFIHIIIYVVVAVSVYYILKMICVRALKLKLKSSKVNAKRQKTINAIISNLIKYFIIFVVVILILKEFGINTTSLLASLGIVGVVVGLALQDTLKDFVSGVFIITDRQYEVGDYVTIDDFTGEVIAMGLKTTKIKGFNGEIKTLVNSSISGVINYSQSDYTSYIDVSASYEDDIEKVLKVLNKVAKKLEKLPEVKSKVSVLGLKDLKESSVDYRISVNSSYIDSFKVCREVNKLVKEEFDKEGITIPYPQVEVHHE